MHPWLKEQLDNVATTKIQNHKADKRVAIVDDGDDEQEPHSVWEL